jgi:hypothetical protein
MTKEIAASQFNFPVADVGHTCVIGSTSANKSVPSVLKELWGRGHPGGTASLAQAVVSSASHAKAKQPPRRSRVAYYRQFHKRK